MHQNQRIIMWLEQTYGKGNENVKIVIEALKKQIPKKPTYYSIDNNKYTIYECKCPKCKAFHREFYPFAYCNHCGQALDWSDTE